MNPAPAIPEPADADRSVNTRPRASRHGLASKLSAVVTLAMTVGLAASCNPSSEGASEQVGEARSAVFNNGGFETGAAGTVPAAPWILTDNRNPNTPAAPNDGVTIQNPQTLAGLNLTAGGKNLTTILNAAAGPLTQVDQDMGSGAALRWPRYGNQCAKLNAHSSTAFTTGGTNNGRNANTLTQTMTVSAGDVDPSDNQVHIRFVAAPVLEDPGHPANEQPYFFIQVTNLTRANAVLYSNFNFSNQSGVPWQTCTSANCTGVPAGTTYRYTNWQLIDVAPGSPAINIGDSVQLLLVAAGCSLGGHEGELYVDGLGATVPGLFISGTGTAQVNPGSNITYNLNYKNGSAAVACTTSANCTPTTESCVAGFCAENGVVANFTMPPGTTFLSFTPPAGATCVPPAVGSANGTLVCTFTNPISPGASGGLTVTVAVPPATPAGLLACGNYQIGSTQETPLLGNIINTEIGCSADVQCSAGTWCNETTKVCTPTLSNGTAVPKDPAHIAPEPVVNGLCNVAAGTLVCNTKVCDTGDNECGYANGDGPCTPGTPASVCRSNVCDPDGKCGYASGDGPCAGNNALCRTGLACSLSGLCELPGTCDVDADCVSGNWCNISGHKCTPTALNGAPVGNDPGHVVPVLNGNCGAGVGALTCASGVCDTGGLCGYANGTGPCTGTGTAADCRSNTCSVHGTVCVPATNGCAVDADCSSANYCDTSSFTCVPKLPNGQPLPVVGSHTPVLDGTCGAGVGASVCASGVCDTDGKCGNLNGDGPCAAGTPAPVCRSGVCDPDLKCGYASGDGPCVGNSTLCRTALTCSLGGLCETPGTCNLDIDCTGGDWCNINSHTCTAKGVNGASVGKDLGHTTPVLDGNCGAGVGALTCVSGVCDTDGLCGYAVGDGPCTGTGNPADCRSSTCSSNGKCEPMNGCNVDADCPSADWCNESSHACTLKLVNGTSVPTDPLTGGTAGTHLNGTCTAAAGAIVCQSGVCDPNDNQCGLANGDPGCTGNAGACRTSTCSTTSVCGCAVDSDCATGNWCNEGIHTCTPQLANSVPIPTDPSSGSHVDGTCTAATGALVCQSGVCDPKDNECGLATGDAPCVPSTTSMTCRSGACGAGMVCIASDGCVADTDCSAAQWCNETQGACLPLVPNGMTVPDDGLHKKPTLNGMCTMSAAMLTCASGVCDPKDNECGFTNGVGPCTADNGATVCRSTFCATTGANPGTCVACLMDAQCSGTTPVCDTTTGSCVECVTSAQCSDASPLCDTASNRCVACNGDNGSQATHPCSTTAAPFCFLSGAMAGDCGKCATDADCTGDTGTSCDAASGLCVQGCHLDSECSTSEWCTGSADTVGMCSPKIGNGMPLPSMPSTVATCTPDTGERVCTSGICDPVDNECGLAGGDGPCADSNQCRNDMCDATTMICAGGCKTDLDCPSADYCTSDGTCTPKLPIGMSCGAPNQCQSADCTDTVCSSVVGSGNGLLCAVGPVGSPSGGGAAGLFGLMLAAVGLARRRRSDRAA